MTKAAHPKWSIKGKGQGEKLAKDGPGPGEYESGYNKRNTPNYSFGSKLSKSFYEDKSSIPGPGCYQSPSTLDKKGGYLGKRSKARKADELPGPGAYQMGSTFSNRFSTAFGRGKRSNPNLNRSALAPGPGTYEPSFEFSNSTHGVGFGISKRDGVTNKTQLPGPGQYTVSDSLFRDPKAASIKGRPKTMHEDEKPGPGHYQSKTYYTTPAYSMGVKTKLKELVSRGVPGPGGYNPEFTKVRQGIPGMRFGSPSKPSLKKDLLPGPGQYPIKSTVGSEGPSYGIQGRHSALKTDLVPGPGNYNPKDEAIRNGTPGTIMGKGKRQDLAIKNQIPGPGNYDLNTAANPGKMFSFGSDRRHGSAEKRTREIPGPGTYTAQTFVGKDSQGFSIAGKIPTKYGNDVPGPGAYPQQQRRNGPSFSLSGHRTEDPILREKFKIPPPGTYEPNDSLIKSGIPAVSFGHGQK